MTLTAKFFLLVAGVGVAGVVWSLMNGWDATDVCWVIGFGLVGFVFFRLRRK